MFEKTFENAFYDIEMSKNFRLRRAEHISLPEIGDYTIPEIFGNKKFGLLKSALNHSPVQFAQFSHKLWILKLSLVKVRGPELRKNRPSIRAA